MKALPATPILSLLGFLRLARGVRANASQAFFTSDAAPALLLIRLSSITPAVLTFREGQDCPEKARASDDLNHSK